MPDTKISETKKIRDENISSLEKNAEEVNSSTDKNTIMDDNEIGVQTPEDFDSLKDAQDVNIRDQYLKAISDYVSFDKKTKKWLVLFYIFFIFFLTAFICFIIACPSYPLELKKILCGAFFANIVSVLIIMVKSSFSPIDKNIMSSFEHLSNKGKSKKN